MKIRELELDDLFSLVDIFAKATDLVQKEVMEAAKSNEGKEASVLGLKIILILYNGCKEDLKTWLGSLCGKNADEVGHLSLADMASFVKALREQEGIKDFFTELWALLPSALKNIVKGFLTSSKPDTTSPKPSAESSNTDG